MKPAEARTLAELEIEEARRKIAERINKKLEKPQKPANLLSIAIILERIR